MIHRYLETQIRRDIEHKLVLLCGPRQVGKTTLTSNLTKDFYYLNYDVVRDRKVILTQGWPQESPLLIFDELHKLKRWKTWLKGVWDGRSKDQQVLVTGSARLDTFRKGGDSLAGRFLLHRLHPFSVKELEGYGDAETVLGRLMQRGGFPEPFLAASDEDAARWRTSHIDRIVRDDVSAIEKVNDVTQLELLVELLADRVGGAVSYKNLAEDMLVSAPTVKRWIGLLEALYLVFLVRPFTRSSARSIRKEPKAYFFDTGRLDGPPGAKLENLVACHLLKWCHYRTDTRGEKCELFYVRDKEQREVDFAIAKNGKLEILIEVKSGDETPHKALSYYGEMLNCDCVQLVQNLNRATDSGRIKIRSASKWLGELEV